MAVKQAVTILAEAAQAEALKLTPADLMQTICDSALRCSTRDDVSFHYKITPDDMARVDRLIELYSQGKRRITRNDIVRAAIIVFLELTEKVLVPERTRQAQEAVSKLLELLTDLPSDDRQALRRTLFDVSTQKL